MIELKILIFILVILYFYLRKQVKCLIDISKASNIIVLYNSFFNASGKEKEKFFLEIARNKPLTDDLLNTYYYSAPSYEDFSNDRKLGEIYTKLFESIDKNRYNFKKYFHPKYLISDIFYLPAGIFGFLLRHSFGRIISFLLSCLTWIATIIISAYATELRVFIDSIIDNLI